MSKLILFCVIMLFATSLFSIQYDLVISDWGSYTDIAWGDYDNDCDEDYIITGGGSTTLYRNDGNNTFTPLGMNLMGFTAGSVSFCDFDVDSDKDIVLCGYLLDDNYNPDTDPLPASTCIVYRNEGNDLFSPTVIQDPWNPLVDAKILYTQQNDSFILNIVGQSWGGQVRTQLFSYSTWDSIWNLTGQFVFPLNNATVLSCSTSNGVFGYLVSGEVPIYQEITAYYQYDVSIGSLTTNLLVLPHMTDGKLTLIDYDADADQDVLIQGAVAVARIYQNDLGALLDVSSSFPELGDKSCWADWDNDNDLDLLATVTAVYLQNSNHTFTQISTNISSYWNNFKYVWFDFDCDLDLDFLSLNPMSRTLYRNEGNANFTYLLSIDAPIYNHLDLQWVDYDFDGDYDLSCVHDTGMLSILRLNGEPQYTKVNPQFMENWGASWADYDNDGYMDVLCFGNGPSRLYSQDVNGTFNHIVDFPFTREASWIDYNRDGLLDISLLSSQNDLSLYRNDGNDVFSHITFSVHISFTPSFVSFKNFDWGDYDNDGDPDLLINSVWTTQNEWACELFRNEGNDSFVEAQIGITGTTSGRVEFVDYDNDGLLDIFISGRISSATPYSCRLYHNTGNGVFLEVDAGIVGMTQNVSAWGDHDNDGDLDLYVSGYIEGYTMTSKLYRNDNNDLFTDLFSPIGVSPQSAQWADLDNDGDLDLLTSYRSNLWRTHVNLNNNGMFNNSCSGLSSYSHKYSLVDYNNDNRLDVFQHGYTQTWGYFSHIMVNTSSSPNIPPTSPTIGYNGDTGFTLSGSIDDNTPTSALTYNLRIGTSPGASDVLNPIADLVTGQRRILAFGRHTWGPMDLPGDQTYYAAAQAIDNAYAGSVFGPEISFYVPPKPQFKLISSATLNFGEQYIGYDSAPQTISITNTGTAALVISDLIHSLADSPFHIVETGLPYTVAVGDTLNLTVIFCPLNTSALADTLSMPYNGAYYHTQYISLSGTGIHVPPSVVENVQLNMQDDNANLSWSPVHSTIFDVPLAVDRYVVIFSEDPYEAEHSFYYLGSTPDTTFIHLRVATFRKHMFYKVKAVKFYDREQAAQFDNLMAGRNDLRWRDVVGIVDEVRKRRF